MAIAVPLATYLAKEAAVSVGQVIATLAINYYLSERPLGTMSSPVFSVDAAGKMKGVLGVFRVSLFETLGLEKARDLLPIQVIDSPLPVGPSSILNPKYFQITDLRPRQTNLKGAVREIIEHIHAKLRAYYDSHRKGWVYNNPQWGTETPIEDHVLLILLLIDCVLHAVGAYRKRIDPDDAIALVDVLFSFKTKLEHAKLSGDGRGGEKISLATLFLAEDFGITKEWSDLRFVFEQEKARRLFVLTVQGIEQSVFKLSRAFQGYSLEWLQGNDASRTSSDLITSAGIHVIPQTTYEGLSVDTRPGSLKDMVKTFCDKRCPEESFRILQLMCKPIVLSRETAGRTPDRRVLVSLYKELNLSYSPSDEPEMTLNEFESYCQAQIRTVLTAVGFKSLPPEDLLNLTLWSRYFMVVTDIFDKVSILGDLVGCMAGALLPNVVKILEHLLDEVGKTTKDVIRKITSTHYASREYQDDRKSSNLRSTLSEVVECIRSNKETLITLKRELSIATSEARLKENEAEIYASLLSLRESLLMLYPKEKSLLDAEMANFSEGIHKLFSSTKKPSDSPRPMPLPASMRSTFLHESFEPSFMTTRKMWQARSQIEKLGQLVETPRDGHCLFHAVGMATGLEDEKERVKFLRAEAVRVLQENEERLLSYFHDADISPTDSAPTLEVKKIRAQEYYSSLKETTRWGSSLEVHALAIALNRQIIAVSEDHVPQYYQFRFDGNKLSEEHEPIVLYYEHGNHYMPMRPLEGSTQEEMIKSIAVLPVVLREISTASYAEGLHPFTDAARNVKDTRAKQLSTILFKEEHLEIMNQAYSPISRGYWKTERAKNAKLALAKFIKEKDHIKAIGHTLRKESFASCSFDELQVLIGLLMNIYSVSQQRRKHLLGAMLGANLASCFSKTPKTGTDKAQAFELEQYSTSGTKSMRDSHSVITYGELIAERTKQPERAAKETEALLTTSATTSAHIVESVFGIPSHSLAKESPVQSRDSDPCGVSASESAPIHAPSSPQQSVPEAPVSLSHPPAAATFLAAAVFPGGSNTETSSSYGAFLAAKRVAAEQAQREAERALFAININ